MSSSICRITFKNWLYWYTISVNKAKMMLRKQFLKGELIGIEWEFRNNAYWVFEKGAKTIQLRKIVFSSNGAETTGYPHAKE